MNSLFLQSTVPEGQRRSRLQDFKIRGQRWNGIPRLDLCYRNSLSCKVVLVDPSSFSVLSLLPSHNVTPCVVFVSVSQTYGIPKRPLSLICPYLSYLVTGSPTVPTYSGLFTCPRRCRFRNIRSDTPSPK